MSASTNFSGEPPLSRDQVKALGALAEELGEVDNDLKLSYGKTPTREAGPVLLGPELWEIILIYLSGKALDAATSHAFDSVIDHVIRACKRWFRKQRSIGAQAPIRIFAVLDEDGHVIRRFEIRQDETVVELPRSWGDGEQSTEDEYTIDTVFVIDLTDDMSPVIDAVKKNTLSFQDQLVSVMEAQGKTVHNNRVRVITFSNSIASAGCAIESTDFLRLPKELAKFQRFVRRLKLIGARERAGGELEALALAMGSSWGQHTDRYRQVIVVFTNTTAEPIAALSTVRAATYPIGTRLSLEDLSEHWDDLGNRRGIVNNAANRLVIFAPDAWPWDIISCNWENVIFYPSLAGLGLDDWTTNEILTAVAHDI
jgi:hypothetical protein